MRSGALCLFACLVVSGCSLIIEPGEDVCSAAGGCPTGSSCDLTTMRCTLCGTVDVCGNGVDDDCDGTTDEGAPETCNMEDDDCDGVADNGLEGAERCNGFDDDCDGADDEGLSELLDRCGDDYDEDCDGITDEGEPELCDNADNDCDGRTDEEASCAGADACIMGRCQVPSCLNSAVVCAPDEVCDSTQSPAVCIERTGDRCTEDRECPADHKCAIELGGICTPTVALGEACVGDFSCADGFCGDTAAIGDPTPENVCTTTCCSDTDCTAGLVCATGLLGSSLCVPPGPGRARSGEACDLQRDCASHNCMGDQCVPKCLNDASCGPEVCAGLLLPGEPRAAPARRSTMCGPMGGARGGFRDCGLYDGDTLLGTNPSVCRNRLCVEFGDVAACLQPCGNSDDCATGECGWLVVSPTSVARVCIEDPGGARTPAGVECAASEDCRSLDCSPPDDAGVRRCLEACCTTCPNGFQCRPALRGGAWPSLCVPIGS